MNRAQILARMKALADEAEKLLPKVAQRNRAAVEEHGALLDAFDALNRSLEAMDATAERSEANDVQFRSLTQRASLGRAVDALIAGEGLSGAEAELQQERSLSGNVLPLDFLEQRAVTPAPTETGMSQARVVQPVFATGDAAFLRVMQRRVPVGDAAFPVLTTRPTVGGPHTDSTDVTETTGAFAADMLSPGRLQAAFLWRRTDAARFAGMESALRQALGSGLSESVDKELVDQIVSDVTRTDATAQNTYATYRSALVYDRIDGRFASVESDIRLLAGSATLAHAAGQYRTANSDEDAATALRSLTGGVRVSPHVAAVAANKQDALVRRGGREDAVVALWEGVTLIPDAITKADSGEIKLTAVMLAAFKVTRDDGFARVQTQHA